MCGLVIQILKYEKRRKKKTEKKKLTFFDCFQALSML